MAAAVMTQRISNDRREYEQPPGMMEDCPSDDVDEKDLFHNEDSKETEEAPKLITYESLPKNYKYLKDQLESLEVIDHLHQSDIFSDEVLDELKESPSRRRRNDVLIKKIFYIAVNKDSKVLDHFADALVQTRQTFIIDYMKNCSSTVSGRTEYSLWEVKRFFAQIKHADTIEPRDFIDDLVEENAITFHDHEDITTTNQRKERVDCLLKLAKPPRKNCGTIIKTIQKNYPKLFGGFQKNSTVQQTKGEAISIRMNLISQTKNVLTDKHELREFEKKVVQNFKEDRKEKKENNVMVNDLEECITLFEGLKISSIVIQLLAQDKTSESKILTMVQQGKAVDWLFSLIDEKDKRYLRQLDVTHLNVLVYVDPEGNLNSIMMKQECICQLNKWKIKKHKDLLAEKITNIDSLIKRIRTNCAGPLNLLDLKCSDDDKVAALLDALASKIVPRVWYCFLEDHLKKEASDIQDVFEEANTDTEFDRDDIKKHMGYLKEELELHPFLAIIRSWTSEKSESLLAKLDGCLSRGSRLEEFLAFLLNEEDVSWFWKLVKVKHYHIWETIATSKRSFRQSEKDVLALKLMNDTIVEEVDPYRLTKYLSNQTKDDLGFIEFEAKQNRKLRTQYILNRISSDNIGEFMVAIRQGGYEHIYRQIKEGSRANQYACPRIYKIKPRKKGIFKGTFDLSTSLRADECSPKHHLDLFSPRHSLAFQDYEIREDDSPFSSTRRYGLEDSANGSMSGSEDLAYEIANTLNIENVENSSSCSLLEGRQKGKEKSKDIPSMSPGKLQSQTFGSINQERDSTAFKEETKGGLFLEFPLPRDFVSDTRTLDRGSKTSDHETDIHQAKEQTSKSNKTSRDLPCRNPGMIRRKIYRQKDMLNTAGEITPGKLSLEVADISLNEEAEREPQFMLPGKAMQWEETSKTFQTRSSDTCLKKMFPSMNDKGTKSTNGSSIESFPPPLRFKTRRRKIWSTTTDDEKSMNEFQDMPYTCTEVINNERSKPKLKSWGKVAFKPQYRQKGTLKTTGEILAAQSPKSSVISSNEEDERKSHNMHHDTKRAYTSSMEPYPPTAMFKGIRRKISTSADFEKSVNKFQGLALSDDTLANHFDDKCSLKTIETQ